MAISDEDWQQIQAHKRAVMQENQDKRQRTWELATEPTPAMVRRKEEQERLLKSRLAQLRDEKVKPINLDNLR